jgi:hypothetical protein
MTAGWPDCPRPLPPAGQVILMHALSLMSISFLCMFRGFLVVASGIFYPLVA